MSAEALRDADRRNVESPAPTLGGNIHHPLAADQTDGLLPTLHQVGQQHDIEFDRCVFEHSTAGALESADGYRVGHLPFGTEYAAKIVFNLDAATGSFFQFLFEKLHRPAARIRRVLCVGVPEKEYAVIADRRRRPRHQGRDQGNQYVTNQGITSPFGALTRSSPAMSSQE
jgi:hypothetical protein